MPAECEAGFLLEEHPFLLHYLTLGDACTATGTSGKWNAMTGNSDGWQQVTFDLSAYAGQQVEVSISYVTDPSTGGEGAFIDDTEVLVDGAVTERKVSRRVWVRGRYPVHLPEAHRPAATSECAGAVLPRCDYRGRSPARLRHRTDRVAGGARRSPWKGIEAPPAIDTVRPKKDR